jgi:hypothetical protein
MLIRSVILLLSMFGFLVVHAKGSLAQDETTPQSATKQQQSDSGQKKEDRLKRERKAAALLEEVVSDAQAMQLPENRVRVEVAAADVLWPRDQARALALFGEAASAIAQRTWKTDPGDGEEAETMARLRRELVLTVARHDSNLAFQLLSSTRPLGRTSNGANQFDADSEARLEQSLLSVIAATDPKAAFQKVFESLDKGEFPLASGSVLRRLYSKDKEAFEKLSAKLLSKLASSTLIDSVEAGKLVVDLLEPGPIPDISATGSRLSNSPGQDQALSESAYRDLMDAVITAALTASPNITTRTQDVAAFVGIDFTTSTRGVTFAGDDTRGGLFLQPLAEIQPDDEHARQNNARVLLIKLQQLLPRIEKYAPDRALAMRQKLTELGINNNQITSIDLDQGTSESLMDAARSAPPQIQSQIYKHAAQKALDEGNTERALQIAKDHVDGSARETITQGIELKKMTIDASPANLAKLRQKLAALPSDSARVMTLLDLATTTAKDDPKLALTLLEDARNIVNKRANKYQDFADQLKVAEALAVFDLKQSFGLLELGIAQLNELLAASAVVNGFEAEVFREGELPLQGGSELGKMVARYGWELGSLARVDFDLARMAADKFQLPESRLLAKLLIAQRVLGGEQNPSGDKPVD